MPAGANHPGTRRKRDPESFLVRSDTKATDQDVRLFQRGGLPRSDSARFRSRAAVSPHIQPEPESFRGDSRRRGGRAFRPTESARFARATRSTEWKLVEEETRPQPTKTCEPGLARRYHRRESERAVSGNARGGKPSVPCDSRRRGCHQGTGGRGSSRND